MKPGPFAKLIGTAHRCDAKPGEGSVEYRWDTDVFKPLRVERVGGIDYSAFKIRGVWIGQYLQWQQGVWAEPWPAEDIFKFDVPMTTLQMGLSVTIQFINTSDKPQPFAVKLVGKLKR